MVRCFAEDGSEFRDYRFDRLPLAEGLRRGLARAFSRRTAPGAGLASLESTHHAYRQAVVIRRCYLSCLAWPPRELAHLVPEHLDGFSTAGAGQGDGWP